MAKKPNQKLKLIYLSRILQERTDAHHGLTLSEITAALKEYGISAERKSLYDDMEVLIFVFNGNIISRFYHSREIIFCI